MSPRDRTDDDTDPETSRSGSWRLQPAPMAPEEGALSSPALGAMRLLVFIGVVLSAALGVSGVAYALATVAAERVVAPVRKAQEDHELSLAGKRLVMDIKTESFERSLSRIEAKIDRVCAASARPAVCLSGGDR